MTIGYGPRVVTDGLVLALDAADRNSYPGYGTTWTDLSGNGNHFTLYNSPSYDGKKITFNGTNQYAQCNNASCGDFGSSSYSIEYCANLIDIKNYSSIIMKRGNITSIGAANSRGWAHRSNVSFFAQDNNPGGSIGAIPSINLTDSTSIITHNVMVLSRSGLNYTINFYKNNSIVGSKTGTLVGDGDITNATSISLFYTYGENVYTAGDIYFVRMYNRALTAAEIQQNYNALRGRFGI